ncbi:MAG: hypothetical protein WD830_03575 [Chloroflexota bacterium]
MERPDQAGHHNGGECQREERVDDARDEQPAAQTGHVAVQCGGGQHQREGKEEESVAVGQHVTREVSIQQAERHPDRRHDDGYRGSVEAVSAEGSSAHCETGGPSPLRQPGQGDNAQDAVERHSTGQAGGQLRPAAGCATDNQLQDHDRECHSQVDNGQCRERERQRDLKGEFEGAVRRADAKEHQQRDFQRRQDQQADPHATD